MTRVEAPSRFVYARMVFTDVESKHGNNREVKSNSCHDLALFKEFLNRI